MNNQKKGNHYLVRARRQENTKFVDCCFARAKQEGLQPEESVDHIFGAIVKAGLDQGKDIDVRRQEPNIMFIQDKTEQ